MIDTPPLDTRDRILAAAVEAVSLYGIGRVSVGDVAQRAGLSRPTLYKHFPTKTALVSAAVSREAALVVDEVLAAASTHESLRDAIEAGVLAALRLTRQHPLLDRIVRTEPEVLLPLLTADGGPVMSLVRRTVEQVARPRVGAMPDVAVRRLCDIVSRLLVSYAVSAPDDPPEVVAPLVARLLVDGATSVAGAVSLS